MDHVITDTERLDWLEKILRQQGMILKRDIDGRLALLLQQGNQTGVFSALSCLRETADVWLKADRL